MGRKEGNGSGKSERATFGSKESEDFGLLESRLLDFLVSGQWMIAREKGNSQIQTTERERRGFKSVL